MNFYPIDSEIFFKSTRADDPRLGQLTQATTASKLAQEELNKHTYAIIGYPDDEGVLNVGGRPGAALAPDVIRKYFYKMTPHLLEESLHNSTSNTDKLSIYDIGNLNLKKLCIEEKHIAVQAEIEELTSKQIKIISLGGGHDFAYPDIASFLKQNKNERPLIINFDAHLDVRPHTTGINSGTSFYRIAQEFTNFDLVQIGIQSQCNSKKHYEYCTEKSMKILSYDEFMHSNLSFTEYCISKLDSWIFRQRKCFISIDIDAFDNSYAPGCSQSFATGIRPYEFFQLFYILQSRLDVQRLGIYEVSPPLDQDDRTAKLAALIMHKYIYKN